MMNKEPGAATSSNAWILFFPILLSWGEVDNLGPKYVLLLDDILKIDALG
jgi:hypothetical protein